MSKDPKNEFEQAGQEKELGVLGEFVEMLKDNKKYWLIPILLLLLIFGVIVMLGGTAVAPFIYQLF